MPLVRQKESNGFKLGTDVSNKRMACSMH